MFPDMTDEAGGPEKTALSVYDVIMVMTEQMASLAWQKMGLQPDMITGEVRKDLAQAKTAVDVTAGLAAFLEPQLDEEDKRRIHNLVRDLRMNYVSHSQE